MNKTLAQELNFIRSATFNDLKTYIKRHSFSHKAEKAFVLRGFHELTLTYIQKYGLQSLARIIVFRDNVPKLVNALLAWGNGSFSVLNDFLTHGDYHVVKNKIAHIEELPYPEQDIIENDSVDDIMSYIATHKLCPFAKCELIMRNIPQITSMLIRKGHLNEREKIAIVEKANWQEVALLVDTQTKPLQRKTLWEMQLIRFSSKKKVERYIALTRFTPNAERFFFKHGKFSSLVKYIKHYNPKNGEEILLSRSDPKEILNYLSKNKLCEKGEEQLLNRGKHREIKAYIKSHKFSPENEARFIKRGKHQEIMLYLSRHVGLSEPAQIELIYRRNTAELTYFLCNNDLTEQAAILLEKICAPHIISVWQENLID